MTIRKILVTGSREWSNIECVVTVLQQFESGTVLIHGKCRGADVICAAVGEQLGFTVKEYPADWIQYGKAAGVVRNQQMLNMQHLVSDPIDLCLSFHDDITNSKGTADMVRRVLKAGIPHGASTTLVPYVHRIDE
jgi:hypothetical protein